MQTQRTRKMLAPSVAAASTLAAAVVLPAMAVGQDGFSAQRFFPAPAQSRDFLSLFSASTGSHLDWEVGAWFNYASGLLVERDADGEEIGAPVDGLFVADVVGQIAFIDRLAIAFDVPIVLLHSSSVSGAAALDTVDAGAGLGDIRLIPRASFWSTESASGLRFELGAAVPVMLPTGDRELYHGSGFAAHPVVAAELGLASGLRAAINVGAAIRGESSIANPVAAQLGDERDLISVNDGILIGAAAEIPVVDVFRFVGEINSEIGLGEGSVSPVEILLGGELQLEPGVVANLAFGRGLTGGYGAPEFRVVFGAGYAFDHNTDRDADGILNAADECPSEAEDPDGFEDEDGCPDNDNDEDGIPDSRDRCAVSAEDPDGFEDEDGCPELDNDQDGVFDPEDQCPLDAEDADGFEDADGCPDVDNDQDGLLDGDDECPDVAEDPDGFADDDGCPDLDNDQDGLLDAADACPDQAEVANGVDDTDGCPDTAPIELLQAQGEVRLLQPITFEGTASLSDASQPVLDALANLVTAYPVLRLRVVVFSYDRRDEEQRIEVSTRRAQAVVEALVERGVDAGRLQSAGYAIAEGTGDTATRVEIRLVR